jgi:hypothetical protein
MYTSTSLFFLPARRTSILAIEALQDFPQAECANGLQRGLLCSVSRGIRVKLFLKLSVIEIGVLKLAVSSAAQVS